MPTARTRSALVRNGASRSASAGMRCEPAWSAHVRNARARISLRWPNARGLPPAHGGVSDSVEAFTSEQGESVPLTLAYRSAMGKMRKGGNGAYDG
jgi:hypothetical protein